MQCHYVSVESDPNPRSGWSLRALAQVDLCTVLADASKIVVSPIGVFEAEYVDVKTQASLHICDIQDGGNVLDTEGRFVVVSHVITICLCESSFFWGQRG